MSRSLTLPLKRLMILIEEIQETEEQFQDLVAYRHWIPVKDYNKRRNFLECRLGTLYRNLMKLVSEMGLWHINVDNNTVNYTFWRGK